MRISDNMILRNYNLELNKSTQTLNELNLKVTSGRSYQKASENPSAALKAMQVRRTLSRIADYQSNVSDIQSMLTEKESAISEINDVVSDAATKILQGKTGTYSESDRKTIAATLRAAQASILNAANSKYGDKYVFGGSESYTIPFTLDSSGNLLYQGTDVNTGTFGLEEVYCDIGLGLKEDSSGNIVAGTAYNVSNPGSELLGTGTDSDGLPNNVYNLLGEIATMFENNDLTSLGEYSDKLDELKDNVLLQYTSVGEESSFIGFISDRLTTSKTNSTARQTELEGIDTAEATLEYSQQEVSYKATLQVGAKLIPQTLLDYLT